MKNAQTYAQSADIYKTNKKIRIEEDSTLPDYCSDVTRVIKAEAIPTIASKKAYIRDDALFCDVSGTVRFNLIYLSEGGGIERHSYTADFYDSTKADVSGIDPDTLYTFASPSCENVVCKVQSPRRVVCRTDLALSLDARANKSFECWTDSDGTVEKMEKQVASTRIASSKDAEFKMSEEIKLPKTLPPMERILSAILTVSADETKAGDNSVSFWGNAGVSCIYLPEGEERIEAFYQPLEIKGSFEVDDARSDMSVLAEIIPSKLEYEIAIDELGENRVLKIDFSYIVEALVEENTELTIAEDVYGISCSITPRYEKREFKKYLGALRENTAIKEKLPLKKGVKSLEGADAVVNLRDTYFENGELFANCRITVSALGITDEAPVLVSESFDTAVHLNLPAEVSGIYDDISFDMSQQTGFVDARAEGGNMSVAFDLTTLANIYYNSEATFVSSVDMGEKASPRGENIFYYPTADDTLWSVGKRYGVALETLALANSITDKELKRVMIIP